MSKDVDFIDQIEMDWAEGHQPDPIEEKVKQSTFVMVRLKDKDETLELSGLLVNISHTVGELSVTLRVDIASALEVVEIVPRFECAYVTSGDKIFKYTNTCVTRLTQYHMSNLHDGTCDLTIGK
jgi:hypothetical protein